MNDEFEKVTVGEAIICISMFLIIAFYFYSWYIILEYIPLRVVLENVLSPGFYVYYNIPHKYISLCSLWTVCNLVFLIIGATLIMIKLKDVKIGG